MVQRKRKQELCTRKKRASGVEKTNLRFMHQKFAENKLSVID